jgi:hypothetical protein
MGAADWSTVEALNRGLGSVRATAKDCGTQIDAVVEQAIRDAAVAIERIPHPGHREALLSAYDALRTARATLHAELARSGRLQATARALRKESHRLIDEAAAGQEQLARVRTSEGRRG